MLKTSIGTGSMRVAKGIALADFPAMLGDKGRGRDGASHEPTKWSLHQFNCFDGEGMDINGKHQYVYLAAYDGVRYYQVRNDKGLGSVQCFRFLINVATTNERGINVIYGGSYDANMMLRDLDISALLDLRDTGECRWRGWHIRYVKRKMFNLYHIPSGKSCTLWDVIGFYQNSFINAV